MALHFRANRWCTLALVISLGGCSAGDVELNGAVFDYLGVSSKTQGPTGVAKLPPRAGIVVPPSTEKLPEPGSGVETGSVASESWPADPEQSRIAAAGDLERRHAAFCQEALWKAKVRNDQAPVRGPNGVCNPSALNAISSNMSMQRPKEGAVDPVSQMPNTFKKQ